MTGYAILCDQGSRRPPTPPGCTRFEVGAGLTLFAAPRLSWRRARRAILVGRLLNRADHLPVDDERLDATLGLAPEELLRLYWGSYVIVRENSGDSVEVIRDPSGSLPCYAGQHQGGVHLASDAGFVAGLRLLNEVEPEPRGMVHWLQYPFLRGARTLVAGIDEVIPGSLLTITAGRRCSRQIWTPARFAAPAATSVDAPALRRLVTECIAAQLADRPGLLQLSGGLDSSIVAACLGRSEAKVEAVTFATQSRDGDEVNWADLAAKQFGIKLTVLRESRDAGVAPATLSFRPGANVLMSAIDQLVEQHRERTGAELLLDGGAGDSLFGYSATAAPVVDAFGAWRGWQTLQSVASHSGASWWRVLRAAIRQALKPPAYRWTEERSFLEPGALLQGPDPHPWLAANKSLPPGKAEHLVSLVHIQHFLDRHAIGGEHLHPLFCQPLLEACLAVPSWHWNANGQDRLLARRAFAELLPKSITERRTKGSLEGFVHRRFDELTPLLRPMILEGELARLGVIDRGAAEAAFREGVDGPAMMRLSEIATLEQWLGSWRSRAA